MKPVLVLKQVETTPAAASFASGGQNPMSNFSPLALVPFPKQVDPITGLQLRAQGPVQYQTPTFQPAVNPYGSFSPEGDFQPSNVFFSDLDPKSKDVDETARAEIRRLGHDPNQISRIPAGAERTGFAQRRFDRFNQRQEREREKFDAAQQKRQAGMSLQERLARGVAGRTGDTQEAFDTAMQRIGRGALAGKIGAGALAGLSGLMALQRANESGTDLFSALGGAGAQGYSTYRFANPALQGLGMRGAARFTPNISQPTSPPVGENLSSSDLHTSAGATPPKTGAGTIQDTLDVGIDDSIHLEEPTVAEPTVQTKPQTDLYGNILTDIYGQMGEGPKHTEHGEMSSAKASPSNQSSIDEEQQKQLMTLYDDFDKLYDAQNQNMNKGNRRSFVGVR